MKMTPICRWPWTFFSSAKMDFAPWVSKAVVGSSAISTSGSAAKARAICDPLLLPTAHFVRVLVERCFRIGELHLFEQGGRKGARLGCRALAMHQGRLGYLPPDAHRRIEGRHRVLKHQAQAVPQWGFGGRIGRGPRRTGGPVSAAAVGDAPFAREQPGDGGAGDAFPRTALAHDGEDFPCSKSKSTLVHHLVFTKRNGQAFDLQQRSVGQVRGQRRVSCSRSMVSNSALKRSSPRIWRLCAG